jgi:hypothetical protein
MGAELDASLLRGVEELEQFRNDPNIKPADFRKLEAQHRKLMAKRGLS